MVGRVGGARPGITKKQRAVRNYINVALSIVRYVPRMMVRSYDAWPGGIRFLHTLIMVVMR